jgi:hypothetical protein
LYKCQWDRKTPREPPAPAVFFAWYCFRWPYRGVFQKESQGFLGYPQKDGDCALTVLLGRAYNQIVIGLSLIQKSSFV